MGFGSGFTNGLLAGCARPPPNRRGNDATVRVQWLETSEILYPWGARYAALTSMQASERSEASLSRQGGYAESAQNGSPKLNRPFPTGIVTDSGGPQARVRGLSSVTLRVPNKLRKNCVMS